MKNFNKCSAGLLAATLIHSLAPCLSSQSTPSLLWEFQGNSINGRFLGFSLANVGDVNGDGRNDVVAGDPRSPGGIFLGRALVLSGANGALLYYFSNTFPGFNQFGHSVAGPGDIDGDLVPDILIGDPGQYAVFLYSGATGLLLRLWTSLSANSVFGYSVCGAGDVDGDNVPDVAIGAPGFGCGPWVPCPNPIPASIFIYSGASGNLIRSVSSTFGDRFGYVVRNAGDFNGDGVPDLLVHRYRNSVAIISGIDGTQLQSFSTLGVSASTGVGDQNNDGFDDVLVGTGLTPFACLTGAAHLFMGPAGGLAFSVQGTTPAGAFGGSVDVAGDVNGDGATDYLIGAPGGDTFSNCVPGAVFAYSGFNGALLFQIGSPLTGPSKFGYAIAGLGDVSGDGLSDFAVGEFQGGSCCGGLVQVYASPMQPAPSCAAGNVNAQGSGGPLDVLGLGLDGAMVPDYGGISRTVVVPSSATTMTLWMSRPSGVLGAAEHLVFGVVGVGFPNAGFALPQAIGVSCFPPSFLASGPGLFPVGDSLGITGAPLLLATTPGLGNPVLTIPRPLFALTFTLQGLIQDTSASGLSITNALRVILR